MTLCWILTSIHKYHVISKYRIPYINFTWEIESWLFKDLNHVLRFKYAIVTVVWLNFDHTQSNIKKWHEKVKLLQMIFFLKKRLMKFSRTSWSLLLCKVDQETWQQIHIPFLLQNDEIALNKISFRKTINVTPMSLLAPFIV